MSIFESSNESYNFYYRGYIGEKFVSAIQIFKFYTDESKIK